MKRIYKNYILQIALILILFLALFYLKTSTRIILSIFLTIYAILICYVLKKRKVISMYNRHVTVLMIIFAIVNVALLYFLGLYFGFVKSSVSFSWWGIIRYIIPISVIIISSELIRFVFLAQEGKYVKIVNIISMILIDLIIYTQTYNILKLNDFLATIGFILFASISANLLYEYISSKYGYKPTIAYRLITSLYMYIFPYIPDIYIFTSSVLKMIYPFIIYLLLEYIFENTKKAKEQKSRVINYILIPMFLIISILITMLVSCKFKYGIMVIGSGSMAGTINKGDITIFEQYTNQEINEEDILIFNKNNIITVHRVISIQELQNTCRYYTKGDANQSPDNGYIENKDIIGIYKMKIPYLGYPTLFIRDIFEKF